MKFEDRYEVPGTSIAIGRRVQYRKNNEGERIKRVSKVYTAEYRESDGKRRFESLGTPNKREAVRRAIQIEKQLHEGVEVARPPTKLLIRTLCERYLADAQNKSLAPTTVAKYRAATDKLLRFCESEQIRLVSQLNPEAFHRFGAWMRGAQHKQRTTYASKTIDTDMTIIKAMMRFALKNQLIRENPIHDVRVPKGKAKPQPVFTEAQLTSMIEHCNRLNESDPSWTLTRDALILLSEAGFRVGELRDLTWDAVIEDRGTHGVFHIRLGGSNDSTKTRSDRFVPISRQARMVLDSLPRDDRLVLPKLRPRTLLARVKRLCRELGYPTTLKTHSIRHAFASRCANRQIPYRMALEFMGHKNSDVLDMYYHLNDEEANRAMSVISEDGIKIDPSHFNQRSR